MRRRRFLSAGLVGLTAKAERPIRGSFVFESQITGHKLRDQKMVAQPSETRDVPVVIVGGGIAGLSAAWWLERKGLRDFVLLELESQPGGNARWSENEVAAYPWAAHYLPVPNAGAKNVRELCAELGLLENGKWNERWLCHSPQERLYLHGRWQPGLEPELGATRRDHEQYRRFEEKIAEFRATKQFTLPMQDGAKASALDRMSMREWMRKEGLDAPYLDWYVDYSCRDDYGASAGTTSAWAGIHYFAARENEDEGPFVWPEGNGWIVRQLLKRLGRYVETDSPVARVAKEGTKLRVLTPRMAYRAEAVIFAAPTFLARLIVEDAPKAEGFTYSPWITANLTLDRWPKEDGIPPAWDNVIYGSKSLGYVVATHQNTGRVQERTVWTWYYALAEWEPSQGRVHLLERNWNWWKEFILRDLERAHPDIRGCVSRIDMYRQGHAMIRPAVGFLFGDERRRWAEAPGPVFYANSDLSGLSIFEEAQDRGIRAAERVLRRIGGKAR
jgi:glycine/D-amino acid oxidase-like deaminating enzyme